MLQQFILNAPNRFELPNCGRRSQLDESQNPLLFSGEISECGNTGKEEEEDFSRLLIQKIKNFNDQFFASEI